MYKRVLLIQKSHLLSKKSILIKFKNKIEKNIHTKTNKNIKENNTKEKKDKINQSIIGDAMMSPKRLPYQMLQKNKFLSQIKKNSSINSMPTRKKYNNLIIKKVI